MTYLVICVTALLASSLTFFSGFGLGTLLLPAFALFFAVPQAVALTAIVHFLNGLFKLILVWRHIDRALALRFGLPAILGAFAGAWSLIWISAIEPLTTYSLYGRTFEITPAKLIVGLLLLFFTGAELLPRARKISFPTRYQPLGGLLSGYFGGLAGMQGALRSAFLIKAGLSKEGYVATGAAIAFFIDVSRLSVYWRLISEHRTAFEPGLVTAAVLAAFMGSLIGNRYLRKATMAGIQVFVTVMLILVSLGLVTGFL